ncbi:glycosyltransferase [Dysgonomonas sp. Marseille-P4361]|uniref:glycosyltransferase n=1 Tax=Dysgonomonas sp. Marseille-P4361 TaxID=2161820 RepID=UPI000D55CEF6|nr:glycosyltransferase [Dysgonomonas sp. Marseille-P4361]
MNILFYFETTINPVLGGVQRITYFLSKFFEANGISTFFLSARKKGDVILSNQYHLPIETRVNITQNEVFFKSLIRGKKIDLVINQSSINPRESADIVFWTKQLDVKTISVFHSTLDGMYGVRGGHLNFIKTILPYGSFMAKIADLMLIHFFKYKYSEQYEKIGRNSDAIVTLSDKFRDEVSIFTKSEVDKVRAIPNPVTIKYPEIDMEKEKTLLFVGRLCTEKQVDILVNIWNKIYKDFPDWNLKILGNGSKYSEIKNLISKLEVKNIELLGFQQPEKYYEKASAFCLTSAYEGFGLALVEAMAYGVVPIAFNSYPNVVDIIDDQKNGYLVMPFDLDEYAEKLKKIMKDDSLRNEMAKSAKAKSLEFNIESIGHQWLNLFNEILK